MSAFLLNDAGSYAATKYAAIVPTANATLVEAQDPTAFVPAAGAATYSVLHNTSATHGGPVWLNVLNSALFARAYSGGGGASIAVRSHPLPFTTSQAALLSANYGFSA